MKYVVLGGTGFIGSAIHRILSARSGCQSISVSSRQCNLLHQKEVKKFIKEIGLNQIIIYAAGIPRLRANSQKVLESNIQMVMNLLDALREFPPKRLFFLSTVEVYGTPIDLPIRENSPFHPENLYSIGKVAIEGILEQWHKKVKVPICILRLPGVYGPLDCGKGFIGALIKSIREEEEFVLFGDGSDMRDYIFVEDMATIIWHLSQERTERLLLNVVSGKSYSLREIIDLVFSLYGNCPISQHPRTSKRCDLVYDNSLLRSEIKGFEFTSIKEGICRYL